MAPTGLLMMDMRHHIHVSRGDAGVNCDLSQGTDAGSLDTVAGYPPARDASQAGGVSGGQALLSVSCSGDLCALELRAWGPSAHGHWLGLRTPALELTSPLPGVNWEFWIISLVIYRVPSPCIRTWGFQGVNTKQG